MKKPTANQPPFVTFASRTEEHWRDPNTGKRWKIILKDGKRVELDGDPQND